MSKKNSPEAKRERRTIRFLQEYTRVYNETQYRELDGQMYPYQRPYRNFVEEYKNGSIIVTEKVIKGEKNYEVKEARELAEPKKERE